MSTREMAERLGTTKSTISRHVKALRESGTLSDAPRKDASAATTAARFRAMRATGHEHLDALIELRDLLRNELDVSGGASMARVSSEYRRCMEEIAALSNEIDVAMAKSRELKPLYLSKLVTRVQDACGASAETMEALLTTLEVLSDMGYISIDELDAIIAWREQRVSGNGVAAGAEP